MAEDREEQFSNRLHDLFKRLEPFKDAEFRFLWLQSKDAERVEQNLKSAEYALDVLLERPRDGRS